MKRRFAFTSVLVTLAMVLAPVTALAAPPAQPAQNGGLEIPYIVIAEDGMTADYIPADGFVTVAVYAEMCNEAVFDEDDLWMEDWSWISLPEAGEGPLGYLSAFLLQWDDEEEEWVEWGWISATRPCVELPAEVGSVCFEGNATHVVGFNGWMVADTLVNFAEGSDFIYYLPEPPSEAHETWEDEVVYADAFFIFWDDVLEEWIWSDLIFGAPCEAAPAPPEPVVTGLWAYVNPAADRNICYILSLTRPTQSEEDNDVRRLCFTESSPDWWQGATLLTHGDVFENGFLFGRWEGDAAARAFNPNALRLPLHAPAGEKDLLDVVEIAPWTQ